MSRLRPPAVAGSFYPADPAELRAQVEGFLAGFLQPHPLPGLKALVAPHAGYVYSGQVAAAAYALLPPLRGRLRRVVLLGPCHRVPLQGLCLPEAQAFATPLGRVEVEAEAREALRGLAGVQRSDWPHRLEHSLEVQLPFLQVALGGDFKLVPLCVGHSHAEEVAEALARLWGGEETLVVVSTDLSHYLPYDRARRLDAETAAAVEAMDAEAVADDQACGAYPLRGFLHRAGRLGLTCKRLMLANSGDAGGGMEKVVGYGAWAFRV